MFKNYQDKLYLQTVYNDKGIMDNLKLRKGYSEYQQKPKFAIETGWYIPWSVFWILSNI